MYKIAKLILVVSMMVFAVSTTPGAFAAKAVTCADGSSPQYKEQWYQEDAKTMDFSVGGGMKPGYGCPHNQPDELFIAITIFGFAVIAVFVTIGIQRAGKK